MTVQHTGAWVSASWALLLIFLSYCLPPVYLWLISDQWDMGYPKFRCTARRHHNKNGLTYGSSLLSPVLIVTAF